MRVLLVDDDPDVRSALRLFLELRPGLQVVGEVARGRDLEVWRAGRALTWRCSIGNCPSWRVRPDWRRSEIAALARVRCWP